jgi:hypothetical protein
MGTGYEIPQWTAPLAGHAAWEMQTAEPFGYDQPGAAWMQASAVSRHEVLDAHARAGQLLQSAPKETLVLVTSMRAAAERDAAQLTQQASNQAAATLATAEREAAQLTQQASDHAAQLTQQASEQAAATRAAAERQAAQLTQQASEHAAAARAAAEREAAQLTQQASDHAAAARAGAERELWTAAMTLLGELNRVRGDDGIGTVTDHAELAAMPAALTGARTGAWPAIPPDARTPARTGAWPATPPDARTGAWPATPPDARTGAWPATPPDARTPAGTGARPATPPDARSAARPAAQTPARTRQFIAARLMVTVTATLVLLVVVVGSAEVALHGFAFFAFRSAGTGATDDNGLQENQGPGQPDAPGAHGRAHQTTPP